MTNQGITRTDSLDVMLGMQKRLEHIVAENRNVKTLSPDGEIDDTIISKCCTAIVHEAKELQDLTNWNPASKPKTFDVQKAREELIDIFHFALHIAVEMNMTAEDLLKEYVYKWKENVRRMKTNY